MKRVVFAVRMETAEEMGANVMLENAASILTAARIKYTLIKYAGDFSIRSEATFPYRIVRDALPLPQASAKNRFQSLSSDDIFRVTLVLQIDNIAACVSLTAHPVQGVI